MIVLFARVTLAGGRRQWIRSVQRAIHTHDVQSILLAGPKLISGGSQTLQIMFPSSSQLTLILLFTNRSRYLFKHFVVPAQNIEQISAITTGNPCYNLKSKVRFVNVVSP